MTGNGSDANNFVVGISSKKLLRRADRDPTSFIFHLDATYKLTQVGYRSSSAYRTEQDGFTYWRFLLCHSSSNSTVKYCVYCSKSFGR